ncbi:MAG TPA: Clp protease N-terminal domain-containing protein [Gemmatimonadaceae bacterium]|nr:Clp protease N-terminal domain-containing protein [Gemmatimonadaceae bacterium]
MQGYDFTERVRRVLSGARKEANRLQHEYVGTEHILLGLAGEGEGVAAAALASLGVDRDDLRRRVEHILARGLAARPAPVDLPYTSRAKKVLELAMSEARELGHSYVGTEHLLLGLLREEKGIAAQVLADAGVTLDAARAEVVRLLGASAATGTVPPPVATVRRLREARTAEAADAANVELVRDTLASAFAGRLDALAPHPGLHGLHDALPALRAALPDLSATPEEVLAAAQGSVASRWLLRGTHLGELYGLAPTGQPIQLRYVSIARVVDGRIVHLAGEAGWLDVLLQLGALRRSEPR